VISSSEFVAALGTIPPATERPVDACLGESTPGGVRRAYRIAWEPAKRSCHLPIFVRLELRCKPAAIWLIVITCTS
jgi:hypothetical protein